MLLLSIIFCHRQPQYPLKEFRCPNAITTVAYFVSTNMVTCNAVVHPLHWLRSRLCNRNNIPWPSAHKQLKRTFSAADIEFGCIITQHLAYSTSPRALVLKDIQKYHKHNESSLKSPVPHFPQLELIKCFWPTVYSNVIGVSTSENIKFEFL